MGELPCILDVRYPNRVVGPLIAPGRPQEFSGGRRRKDYAQEAGYEVVG